MLWLSNQHFLSKKNGGFTIVELMTVIVIMIILAAVVIVGYGAWEKNLASSLVKSDLRAAGAEIEKERNWHEGSTGGYPTGLPTGFTPSSNVSITGGGRPGGATYCFSGTSSNDTSIQYYVSNKQKEPAQGDCTIVVSTVFPGSTAVDVWGSAATLNRSNDLAFGDDGVLYLANGLNLVLKTDVATGTAEAFSGSGASGSDDGAANTATWRAVQGIINGGDGNFYAIGTNNHSTRRISQSDGSVTTIAPTGEPRAIIMDAKGVVYVSGTKNIYKVNKEAQTSTTLAGTGSSGYNDGAGDTAQFNGTTTLAVNSQGDLYVKESSNCLIRTINAVSGYVTTVGGSSTCGSDDGTLGSATFNSNGEIVFDAYDNLWMADGGKLRVLSADGVVTTVGASVDYGYGIYSSTSPVNGAMNLIFDSEGNLWFSDLGSNVKKITFP